MKERELKKLYHSISNVRDQFLEEAQLNTRDEIDDAHAAGQFNWVRWSVLAACLCLIVGGAVIVPRIIYMGKNNSEILEEGGGGKKEGSYSVAVYPPTECEENVASANIEGLTETEALNNPLAEHLPWQLPEGFHYGYGSIYSTVMKSGMQYSMLRIEYISGQISEWKFVEDGAAAAVDVDPGSMGKSFIVCVMNYEPAAELYSSKDEVTKEILQRKGGVCIRTGNCYVSVFLNTADAEAVLEAIKYIE